MLRIVAGVSAVNRVRRKPKSRRDHLCGDACVVQFLLQFLRFLADLRFGFAVDIRHRVIVVKHHRVEPKLLEVRKASNRKSCAGRVVGP